MIDEDEESGEKIWIDEINMGHFDTIIKRYVIGIERPGILPINDIKEVLKDIEGVKVINESEFFLTIESFANEILISKFLTEKIDKNIFVHIPSTDEQIKNCWLVTAKSMIPMIDLCEEKTKEIVKSLQDENIILKNKIENLTSVIKEYEKIMTNFVEEKKWMTEEYIKAANFAIELKEMLIEQKEKHLTDLKGAIKTIDVLTKNRI